MLADIDGLQVIGQASSGEEALKKVRELKPDVVLMDVKMPGICLLYTSPSPRDS